MEAKIIAKNDELKHRDRIISRQAVQLQKLRQKVRQQTARVAKTRKLALSSQQERRLNGTMAHWKTVDIVRALTIRSLSAKAYNTARDIWNIPLPSVSTLRRWTATFSCTDGLLYDVLEIMKQEAASMPEYKRISAISFDEISLCSDYVYDKRNDKMISYSKAQVVMLRGICDSWKQPIFYAYDRSVSLVILINIIKAVEEAGYLVYSVTCDLGAENRSLWKVLHITEENTSFKNPFDNSREVYVFADAPHMLKLIRNHLLDDGLLMEDGTVVSKCTFEKINRYDESELKLRPRLSRYILEVTGAERMRVRYAAQLLSNHTATLAERMGMENEGSFIRTVNDAFDVLNSRVPVDDKNAKKNGYGLNYTAQNSTLDKFINIMQKSRFLLKNGKPRHALLPCQIGFIVTMKSTMALLTALEKYGLTYILTSRLNQDALESLFSLIRSFAGSNTNPTPVEFRYRLRLILLGSRMPPPSGTNSVFEDTVNIMCANLIRKNDLFKVESGELLNVSGPVKQPIVATNDCNNEEALEYLAGYIAWKIKRSKGAIYGKPTPHRNTSWIAMMSRGGLLTPDERITVWIRKCNDCFNSISCEMFQNRFTARFREYVREKHPEIPIDVITEFVKTRVNIRRKYLNVTASKTRSLRNAKKSKQFARSCRKV